jgi:GTP-binding protein EngB required for normal cell division
MDNNEKIRQEAKNIREELNNAFKKLLYELGQEQKPEDTAEIKRELDQLNELLQRLETGLVWVTLFGKTVVGKSSIVNALIGKDVAETGIGKDNTTEPNYYEHRLWMIVDTPGIMGKKLNEQVAFDEAKRAHSHIFVLDGEPFEDELELFELVNKALPDTPKIVFVNKWDQIQNMPRKAHEIVRNRIKQKMIKFVKSPEAIVYGSARLYDPMIDDYVRQELPQLLDRLYKDTGVLGDAVNILNAAKCTAADLTIIIRKKIYKTRFYKKWASIINWFL